MIFSWRLHFVFFFRALFFIWIYFFFKFYFCEFWFPAFLFTPNLDKLIRRIISFFIFLSIFYLLAWLPLTSVKLILYFLAFVNLLLFILPLQFQHFSSLTFFLFFFSITSSCIQFPFLITVFYFFLFFGITFSNVEYFNNACLNLVATILFIGCASSIIVSGLHSALHKYLWERN